MTTPDIANHVGEQHDSQHEAGDTAPDSADAEHTPPSEPDDQDDGGSPGNEAKRYRLRLREAERERDVLRDILERTRQSIVDNAVGAAGLDPRLLTAAGHKLDSLVGDDGLIDAAKLSEAVAATAREFRIAPKGRRPQPNPQQGSYGPPPRGQASWGKALKGG